MDKCLTSRTDTLFWAMSALIGVVLAAIALPQVLGYLYARRERQEIQQLIQNSRVDMQ